jgi:4-aminobutyrate aminotransferase-like enzyme
LQENARATGAALRGAIESLQHGAIAEVRGRGLMIGVEITDGAGRTKAIANAMRARGVLIGTESVAGTVLKIRPPLPFGAAHAAQLVEALVAALKA